MLTEIGSIENVPAFIEAVKQGHGSAPGLRPPRLQELRPPGQDHQAHRRRGLRHHREEPAPRHRPQARGDRPADEYFTSRRLYPNVDFYSGLIYQAMGFPLEMFPVLFAIPRTSGWLAHWQEMLDQDSKIARPRQLYIGAAARARASYVPTRRPQRLRPDWARPHGRAVCVGWGTRRMSPSCTIETTSVPSRREEEAPGQASGSVGVRAVHVVEQPVVGPEGPVEPHAVVQAGAHELGVVPAHLVGGEHGVEQRHVRGVGGDAGVQQGSSGSVAVGPDPHPLDGLARVSCCIQGSSPTWRWSMGWGRANQSASSSR